MYGELSNKLVQHAKRTLTLPYLPPYQTEIVRAVVREVRDLDRDVKAILESYHERTRQRRRRRRRREDEEEEEEEEESTFDPSSDPATACSLLVDHLCMRRNKRCLLAYHRTRAEKLEEMCWRGEDVLETERERERERGGKDDGGGEGTGTGNGSGGGSSLSSEEEEYIRLYGELVAGYKGQWTDVDLTGSLEPPRDLFIDVRVLKDAGEIQTEYGAINLTKNSQFYVRQGDVERLIAQGFLQRLD